jgi:hypothetical protein
MKKIEITILAVVTFLFSLAVCYNVYKNNLIALNAEATIITAKILKAEGAHFDKTGSFIDINAPQGLKINLTGNEFFDEISSSVDGNVFELTLSVKRGFFKGSTAFARYTYRTETFFELSPKTKIPLMHL